MRPRFAVCVTRVVPSVCVGLFSRARGAVFCFIIIFFLVRLLLRAGFSCVFVLFVVCLQGESRASVTRTPGRNE